MAALKFDPDNDTISVRNAATVIKIVIGAVGTLVPTIIIVAIKATICLNGVQSDVAAISDDVAAMREDMAAKDVRNWHIDDMIQHTRMMERDNAGLPLRVPDPRQIVRDRPPQ